MYIRDGQQVPNPDSTSGLYIRRQDGTTVQVRVPADHIAFQMGEAMQACPLLNCSKSDVRLHFYWEYCVDYEPRAVHANHFAVRGGSCNSGRAAIGLVCPLAGRSSQPP